MNDLIKTFSGQLAGETQPLVNARDLHQLLGVGKDFSTWIKDRIERYRFIEGQDFSPVLGKTSGWLGGRPKTEYHLSTYMAEHIAMLEENEIGFKVRDYFRDMTRMAHAEIPAFLRRGANGLGSPAEHQIAVMRSLVLESKPEWAKLRRYFEAGLTQRECAKLLGTSPETVRQYLRHMALIGLVDYAPNPKLVAAGAAGMAKRLEANHA